VTVDGIVVTDDGDLDEEGSDWARQDPDLRAGAWFAGRADARRTLALPEELVPEPGGSRRVVLSVEGAMALPRAWSVHVVPGTVAQPSGAALPTRLPVRPPDVPGLEPAGAWLVPRDGHRHELPLGTAAAGSDPWAWGWGVLDADAASDVPATLTRGEQLRRVPALDGGDPLAETLLRQTRVDRPPSPEGTAALFVSVPPAPGQPLVRVVAWRPPAP
jgi:hypothetical protein